MSVFVRKSDEDRQLVAARRDLEAAKQKYAAVINRQDAAAASTDRWEQWTAAHDAAAADVTRLTVLVDRLQAAAEAVRSEAEAAAKRDRLAAAREMSKQLMTRIASDLPRITAEAQDLARAVARQTLEANKLNADLPAGEEPIVVADFALRDAGTVPREDLASEEVSLWVHALTGELVGNQDAVVSEDGITGHFNANSTRFKCAKRRFASTKFHPRETSDWPGHLFSLIRLPRFDGPGIAFDGMLMTIEAVAALETAPPKSTTTTHRPVQVELRPINPWSPPGVRTDADRNFAA